MYYYNMYYYNTYCVTYCPSATTSALLCVKDDQLTHTFWPCLSKRRRSYIHNVMAPWACAALASLANMYPVTLS